MKQGGSMNKVLIGLVVVLLLVWGLFTLVLKVASGLIHLVLLLAVVLMVLAFLKGFRRAARP
jgi:hypothetical protein